MDNATGNEQTKVTIEDGVCHFEYINELSMQNILASELRAVALMDEQKIDILPFIVEFKDIDDDNTRIEVRDFGKLISTKTLFDRCSGVWIVGAEGNVKMLTNLLNKTFLGDRIRMVDTLEQAKAEAEEFRSVKVPMLEQDVA